MTHIFLINPTAENSIYAERLREDLKNTYAGKLKYFVFNIRYSGYEAELIEKLLLYLDDDKLRFYVVGGLGTLHKVLNSLDGHLSEVEVAWFPTGHSNNFLKNFQTNPQLFNDMNCLIEGTAIPLDFIRTSNGIALNALSLGVDVEIIKFDQAFAKLHLRKGPLHKSFIRLVGLLRAKPVECQLSVDNVNFDLQKYFQLIFNNGHFLGQGVPIHASLSKIDDGIGEYMIGQYFKNLGLVNSILAPQQSSMSKKDLIKTGQWKKLTISSNKRLTVNLDGELYPGSDYWEAELIHAGFNFVIPKGVSMD